mgnify:CR=1 FL=1
MGLSCKPLQGNLRRQQEPRTNISCRSEGIVWPDKAKRGSLPPVNLRINMHPTRYILSVPEITNLLAPLLLAQFSPDPLSNLPQAVHSSDAARTPGPDHVPAYPPHRGFEDVIQGHSC